MSRISSEEVLNRGIMVDVETGGGTPATRPLLSIGACVIGDPSQRFYIELVPDIWSFDKEALAVCKLDPQVLLHRGTQPKDALHAFIEWCSTKIQNPLFVAHNAAFDWMFIASYLAKYDVSNIFGYWPFDTKSAYGKIMKSPLPHHAGEDAYIQTKDLLTFYDGNTT